MNLSWNSQALFAEPFRDIALLAFTLMMSSSALNTNTTMLPLVFTLTGVIFYSSFVFRVGREGKRRRIAALWIALALGGAISKLSASVSALSTAGVSITVLAVTSMLNSSIVLVVLYVNNRISTRISFPWTQLAFFPALWATLWCTVAYISPVGHLLTWSLTNNDDAYQWLVPVFGSASKDWVVGAWSVLFSHVIGAWYMGSQGEDEDLFTMEPSSSRSNDTITQKTSQLILGALLALLTIPSLFSNTLPIPISNLIQGTPLSMACILPTTTRYNHTAFSLDDYIDESKKFRIIAQRPILLWPEGAVNFDNATHREDSFTKIREEVPGPYIGVSFEETAVDPTTHKSFKQTGIAVISQYSSEPHLTYYKRHLVPIAESFSLRHGLAPPSVFDVKIPSPKGIPKGDWAPAPNFTRSYPITTSICLDFAHPSPFEDLHVRPSLVLAPARTWDRTVGYAMWLQARQRAEEIGTNLLWCDGGDGGVSGVAGPFMQDVAQVGQGSFSRTIPVQYPFNTRKTAFARLGDLVLLLFWLVAFIPVIMGHSKVSSQFQKIPAFLGKKRGVAAPNERTPLIDAD